MSGLSCGAIVVLLGYAAGSSCAQGEETFGRDAAFGVLVLVVAVVALRFRGRRAEPRD